MLTPEQQDRFLQSIAGVQRVAAAQLEKMDDAGSALQFVGNLHRGVDKLAQERAASGVQLACQVGCHYCCQARVEAAEPEILLIVRTLRLWPVAERDALIARLSANASADQAPKNNEHRNACALLQDGLCTIYAVRPATCRKCHSLSVQACADYTADIPQDLKLVLDAEALIHGTFAAYRANRLAAGKLELNAALLHYLGKTDAEQEWFAASDYAGENPESN
jgi:hypothetical protein